MQTAYRSQTARYNKLMEDIRNDVVRLDPFFAVAHVVTDLDQKRGRSLAYISNLTPEERANTIQRMRENAAIILWVRNRCRSAPHPTGWRLSGSSSRRRRRLRSRPSGSWRCCSSA